MGEQGPTENETLGFHASDFNWNSYIKHRPMYPKSLTQRLYEHHALHNPSPSPNPAYHTAHDVGAGAGILSEALAERFQRVIVSEPNPDFLNVARHRLSHDERFPADIFTYYAERAEQSSVESGTVDVITICEAIHWTEISASVAEFAPAPRIQGNLNAQAVWEALFEDVVNGLENGDPGHRVVFSRAMRNVATGLDNVGFPEDVWRPGTNRVYTNTGGDRSAIRYTSKFGQEKDRIGNLMNDDL
ncbi:hypothetical protein BO94DRAFT_599132 [Aspergillus sclerotioniger CBS 115572]|uniref:Methyltransferase type 11 domain-containing protein n=1 Tax=Aspergillus sclerotioniger CBS 115572 TaxID=1450535 RepID=A0A317WBI6_9EURO|nr:hypothetical protein BO94DRAFT_599132 [Aspergillus sclerotioniger CBS 115572]PWY83794.1 hypothetical protein BO94DRAFT_599132 [Aspergillus sclerotioniger CBS 115572]